MNEKRKNIRALAEIRHYPKGEPVVRTWPAIVLKGAVVGPDEIRKADLMHLLRNGHAEETDDPVADAPPAATESPGENTAPAPAPVDDLPPAALPVAIEQDPPAEPLAALDHHADEAE